MDSTNPSSQSMSFMSLLNGQQGNLTFQQPYTPNFVIGSSSEVPLTTVEGCNDPREVHQAASDVKKRRQWTQTDDLVLISSWLNTSKDPVVGNQQKAETFWKRISVFFAASPQVVGRPVREPDHCKQRWRKINDQVSKFVGSFAAATAVKKSGWNSQDYIKLALELFEENHKTKFTLQHCWMELKNEQKWKNPSDSYGGGSSRKRPSQDTTADISSDAGSEPRPPGVKAAKAALRKAKRTGATEHVQNKWEINLALKEKLNKQKLLDNLLSQQGQLSDIQVALMNQLIAEMITPA